MLRHIDTPVCTILVVLQGRTMRFSICHYVQELVVAFRQYCSFHDLDCRNNLCRQLWDENHGYLSFALLWPLGQPSMDVWLDDESNCLGSMQLDNPGNQRYWKVRMIPALKSQPYDFCAVWFLFWHCEGLYSPSLAAESVEWMRLSCAVGFPRPDGHLW